MQLSAFTDYALRVLVYAAARPEQRCLTADVATTFGISRHHVVKVVNELQHVVGGKRTGFDAAEGEGERRDQMALVPYRQDLPPAAVPRQIPAPQPAPVRAGRGGASGWGGEYSQYPPQYPQAPYGPYGEFGDYGGNAGNGYGGNDGGAYGGGSRGSYTGDAGSQWGNVGRMPPDGRSRGNW